MVRNTESPQIHLLQVLAKVTFQEILRSMVKVTTQKFWSAKLQECTKYPEPVDCGKGSLLCWMSVCKVGVFFAVGYVSVLKRTIRNTPRIGLFTSRSTSRIDTCSRYTR